MLFLVQVEEWIAMVYIIITQKSRTIEEIYFDHSHEKITHRLEANDKLKFRRREVRIKWVFIFLNYLVLPGIFVISFFGDSTGNYKIKYAIIYSITSAIFTFSFSVTFYLLNKYHKLEFERQRKPMICIFVCMGLILILRLVTKSIYFF